MIDMAIKIEAKRATKTLRLIYTKDLPAAKASAFARAGESGTSKAATRVARDAQVPKWMIAGAGGAGGGKGKKRGSRMSRTKYIRKIDGIYVTFRHGHLNPLGTKHKRRAHTQRKRGGRGVRVGKQFFPDSYVDKVRYSNAVYASGSGTGRLQKIELGPPAVRAVRSVLGRVVPEVFEKRFKYEFDRRVKRRGAR